MIKKILTFLLLAACTLVQAENTEQYTQMKHALRNDLTELQMTQPHMDRYYDSRLAEFNSYVQRCNELQLAIYSNRTEYIFYMTITLKRIERMQKELEHKMQPDHRFLDPCIQEENRLNRLLMSLLRQNDDDSWEDLADEVMHEEMSNDSLLREFTLSDQSQEKRLERDTCIMLTRQLLEAYAQLRQREQTITDNYAELKSEFESTYNYMQIRMEEIKGQVFLQRSFPYHKIIMQLPAVLWYRKHSKIFKSNDQKLSIDPGELKIIFSEMFALLLLAIFIGFVTYMVNRRFPLNKRYMENLYIFTNLNWTILCLVALLVDIYIIHLEALTQAGLIFFSYLCYTILLQISLLMRTRGEVSSAAMHMYAPTLFFGFCSIFIRLFLVHEYVLTIIVFPLCLACTIWQAIALRKRMASSARFDNSIIAITLFLLAVMTVLSFIGYVYLAMVIFFWWQAQVAVLLVSVAFYKLLLHYQETHLKHRKQRYHERNRTKAAMRQQESLIQVTWFFDLLKMVGIPFALVVSIPFCMFTALDYFNAGEAYTDFFYTQFITVYDTAGQLILGLSCYDLCRVVILFFICRYAADFLRKAYTQIIVYIEILRTGSEHIEDNRINLTMGLNIINIVVWAIYLAACCIFLSIPTSALTFIFAGLATGIGFAMRDIINNTFYGIQLMAGRLHVGDYIICGPYRGLVTSISYQTTQMKTEENAIVYFTNSDLFGKNFQNLTRGNPYEVNRVYCDIAYGSDIELAERLIREAIEPLNEVDKFGRPRLSPKEGIRIEMTELGSNGIQMAVRFGIIAEQRTRYLPVFRQAIYKKLQEGGITIPFGQVDVHMITESTVQKSNE